MVKYIHMWPSDIRYSQDSISCYFDSKCPHSSYLLGETVDSICAGRTSLSSVPKITVVYKSGHWYTADNRRLWVFRQLERKGKCDEILVHVGYEIRGEKFTTTDDGLSVRVRGDPWGHRPVRTGGWQSATQRGYQYSQRRFSAPTANRRQNDIMIPRWRYDVQRESASELVRTRAPPVDGDNHERLSSCEICLFFFIVIAAIVFLNELVRKMNV